MTLACPTQHPLMKVGGTRGGPMCKARPAPASGAAFTYTQRQTQRRLPSIPWRRACGCRRAPASRCRGSPRRAPSAPPASSAARSRSASARLSDWVDMMDASVHVIVYVRRLITFDAPVSMRPLLRCLACPSALAASPHCVCVCIVSNINEHQGISKPVPYNP
jgi:hypothetical protein